MTCNFSCYKYEVIAVYFVFRTIVPCLHNPFSMKSGEMRALKSLLKRTHRNRDIDDIHDDPVTCILRHPVVAVFMDIKWKTLERWYAGFLVYQVKYNFTEYSVNHIMSELNTTTIKIFSVTGNCSFGIHRFNSCNRIL